MTLWDVLLFLGRLKGLSRRQAEARVERTLHDVGLWEARERKMGQLSRGMNQKAQFVAATLHEPDLIIVDEPFSGLDPVNTRMIKQLLYQMRDRGAAVIMSTHQMHQVEEMCRRILLIDRGRPVLYGSLDEIRRRFAPNAVEVGLHGHLEQVPGVERLVAHNGGYRMLLAEGTPPAQVLQTLAGMSEVTVKRFEQVETSLDEIFVQVVGREVSTQEMPSEEVRG